MTKILLASAPLCDCSETEVVTLETAMGLRRRGHEVALFTSQRGELAEMLEGSGIGIVNRPEELEWSPDVIHSSYVFPSLALAAAFPHVPQVFVCRDSKGWHSTAPRLSLVRSWGATDKGCAERIRHESLDADAEVEWIANAVDLNQFPERCRLPAKPERAAVFAERPSHLAAVREACRAWFLSLDEFGAGANREASDIEEPLGSYDIVIATSRRALEGLACGCAVILADHRGFAGLVTEENAEAWYRANFSEELLTDATSTPLLVDAIRSYDARSAARASEWIRRHAGIDTYLDQLERMYESAIRAQQNNAVPIAKTLYEMTEAYRGAFAAEQLGVKPGASYEKICKGFTAAKEERTVMAQQLAASDSALKKALHLERQMQQRLRQLSSNVKRLEKEIGTLKRKPAATPMVNYVRQAVIGKWWRWKWKKEKAPTANNSFDEEDT